MEVHHDIRGDASICIIPEKQDSRCATFSDSFTQEVELPGVEIGEEVQVCVTNLETAVQDCETEVNDRGGIDSIEMTVPPDPEPVPSPTPDDTTGPGGISTSPDNGETTSEPLSPQLVQGVLIPLLIIIPVVISIIVLIRRRRRARPADSVDF